MGAGCRFGAANRSRSIGEAGFTKRWGRGRSALSRQGASKTNASKGCAATAAEKSTGTGA